MAQLIYAERALRDLERVTDFLHQAEPAAAEETIALITEALAILRNHPLVGRSVERGLRELLISRGRSGYVALYRFRPQADRVIILAVRHQREAGYPNTVETET